jgi:hypothetical protein
MDHISYLPSVQVRYRVVLGSVYLAALYDDNKLVLTHYASDACTYGNANDAAEAASRLSTICKSYAQVESVIKTVV